MELQFGYTNPIQDPYGINQLIQDENESREQGTKSAMEQKKVRFKEELGLKSAQPLMFESENPKPLTIVKGSTQAKYTTKKPDSKSKKRRSLSGKRAKTTPKASFAKKAATKKPVAASPIKGEWNTDTSASRFFDPSLEKKRAFSSKEKPGIGRKVEISKEDGKITGKIQTVGIPKTVEIYQDVDQLLTEEHKPKTFLKKGARINKYASTKSEPAQRKGKENSSTQPLALSPPMIPEVEQGDPEKERMRYEFNKKNEYVRSLQEELSNEKALRAQIDSEYKAKIDSMVNLVKTTVTTLGKQQKGMAKETDLDLVPQKEVAETVKAQQHKTVPAAPKPVARLKPPTFRPLKPKPIPKKKPAPKKAWEAKAATSAKQTEVPQQTVALFTEEMKKREIERQVKLDEKTTAALEKLERAAYKPAEELQEVAKDLEKFEGKVRPVIEKVGQTIKDIERIERIKAKGTLVGMVSNVSARYIVTYADKITDLMVDDMLEEFAVEMNEIEEEQKRNIFSMEQQELAVELLEQAGELEEEQDRIQNRWTRLEEEKPAKGIEMNITEVDYLNPFDISQSKPSAAPADREEELHGVITVYKPPKKHVIMPKEKSQRIHEYARMNKEYRKKMEGSVSPDIWKIYDHITNDVLSEILESSAGELTTILEQCVEQMISNEFNA